MASYIIIHRDSCYSVPPALFVDQILTHVPVVDEATTKIFRLTFK